MSATLITATVGVLGICGAILSSYLTGRFNVQQLKARMDFDRTLAHRSWLRTERLKVYGELVSAIHDAFERHSSITDTQVILSKRLVVLHALSKADMIASDNVLQVLQTFRSEFRGWHMHLWNWAVESGDQEVAPWAPTDEYDALLMAIRGDLKEV